jgi:hypothetical protein
MIFAALDAAAPTETRYRNEYVRESASPALIVDGRRWTGDDDPMNRASTFDRYLLFYW